MIRLAGSPSDKGDPVSRDSFPRPTHMPSLHYRHAISPKNSLKAQLRLEVAAFLAPAVLGFRWAEPAH